MQYKCLLNYIYQNYKKEKISNIKPINFIKENNTNIIEFEFNNSISNNIKGILLEQNNSIIIYYKLIDNNVNYVVFSKANITSIDNKNHAIIVNYLWENGNLISEETIGRDYIKKSDLYKENESDIIISENILDDDFELLIDGLVELDFPKKYIKRQ